ncbi:MAG: GAF domain-containing protein, partial [Thermomicrobiales bacterium]
MRVLLVTDDSELRALARELALARGHDFSCCTTAGEALTLARQTALALFLLDRAGVDDERLALCRQLRELSAGQAPFIMVAHCQQTVGLFLAAGADTALPGAFNATTLAGALTAAERRSSGAADFTPFFTLSHDLLCIAGFDGFFKRINPAFERVTGFTTAELLAVPYLDFVHPDDRPATVTEAQGLATGTLTVAFENRYRCKSGGYRWLAWNATPNVEQGLIYAVARDITEQRRARAAAGFLADASAVLATSLDYRATLRNIAELAVPRLADWCVIDTVEDDGTFRRMIVVGADPAKAALARELQDHYPLDPNQDNIVLRVISSRRSDMAPIVPDAVFTAAARDVRHLEILRLLGIQSHMIVPLAHRERVFGAITFVAAESGYRYDEHDLAQAEDLARRAAIAVENARLFANEQAARQAAEAAISRVARLQNVTAALAQALTPAEVAQTIATQGIAALGAQAGVIMQLTPDGTELDLLHSSGFPAELIEPWRRFSLLAPAPIAEAARTGRSVLLQTPQDHADRYPQAPAIVGPAIGGALAAAPLMLDGRTVGVMGLSFAAPRAFSNDDREFLLALSRQCAQALERARLFAAERQARAAAEAAQGRLAFLAEASAILAVSLEYETTLASVAELAVPRLGDWCVVDIVGAGETLRRLAVVHADPARASLARELHEHYPPEPTATRGVLQVIRHGQPELVPDVTAEWLAEAVQHPDALRIIDTLGLASLMIVPLTARGRTFGAITLVSATPDRRYDRADLALAEDLGRRAALAVENARLYRESQQAIRARDHFLTVAAHELRTPLTTIRGSAELLLRRVQNPDRTLERAALGERLQKLLDGVDRMASLATRLLDVTRMQGGAFAIDPEPCDLAAIVAGVVERTRATAGNN